MGRKRLVNLPEEVWVALRAFTPGELGDLRAFWNEDGTFWGIGFVGPGGKACRYGDKLRREACDVLEKQYLEEAGASLPFPYMGMVNHGRI